MPCYADDCTIVVARKLQYENKSILKIKLQNVTKFLQSNELCINQTKTKTQNFMVQQKRIRVQDNPNMLSIMTPEGEKDNQQHSTH